MLAPILKLLQHQLSMLCGGSCHFAIGMRGCDVWVPFAWPESFGVEKRHWASAGVSPNLPPVTAPPLLVAQGQGASLFAWEAPAPSSHPELGDEFGEERGSQSPAKGSVDAKRIANKSLFQPVVSICLSPLPCHPQPQGQTKACVAAETAALALTPLQTPWEEALVSSSLKAAVNWASSRLG